MSVKQIAKCDICTEGAPENDKSWATVFAVGDKSKVAVVVPGIWQPQIPNGVAWVHACCPPCISKAVGRCASGEQMKTGETEKGRTDEH